MAVTIWVASGYNECYSTYQYNATAQLTCRDQALIKKVTEKLSHATRITIMSDAETR